MKDKVEQVLNSDKSSKEYLEVNSCGIERIYKKDQGSTRPNGRSDYQMIYVERGVCNLFLDREWKRLPEGTVIIFKPRQAQRYFYQKEDSSVSHYVHFSGVGCEDILKRLGLWELTVFNIGRSTSYEDVSQHLVREFAMRRPMYADWCTSYLYQLLNIVARKHSLRQISVSNIGESRINDACKRIYSDIKTPPTAQELAKEYCLSPSRFAHLFKDVTGRPYSEFVAVIRIERAKELLCGTKLSVREIAESVGYDDQNYFSRAFGRLVGCSPRDYRKSFED